MLQLGTKQTPWAEPIKHSIELILLRFSYATLILHMYCSHLLQSNSLPILPTDQTELKCLVNLLIRIIILLAWIVCYNILVDWTQNDCSPFILDWITIWLSVWGLKKKKKEAPALSKRKLLLWAKAVKGN